MEDALRRGCVEAEVAEALANYALADGPLSEAHRWSTEDEVRHPISLYTDADFWYSLDHEQPPFEFRFRAAALTEWVPRIPGLYWREGSARRREVDPSHVLFRTDRHVTYTPIGKSQVVSGGIGTLRFPPAEDGYRLVTLSTHHNASLGIPTLVSPQVWDARGLAEGCVLRVNRAACRDLPLTWTKRFPIIQGISRRCLVLDDVSAILVVERDAPVEVHPFAVMEYHEGNAQLHDFVFATADTSEKTLRGDVTRFFETYRQDKGREGKYLTSADIANPMWDAVFVDPADMRLQKDHQLRLIDQRVAEAASGEDVTAALIHRLCDLGSVADLNRLAAKADIQQNRWRVDGISLAEAAQRLVAYAIQSGKQLALLHVVQLEFAS